MADGREYTLKIDAYSPQTMPMARLAEYMADLARLLGEEKSVHFVRLDTGSSALVHNIEGEAVPKVRERVTRARRGDGPVEAVRAIRTINKRLREDNGTGVLVETPGAEIIRFPGRDEHPEEFYATVTEEGTLDGVVVRVGGLQDWVPVHLEDTPGRVLTTLGRRDVAKRMAAHLWGPRVRVQGVGTWSRGFRGSWLLERFYVRTFETLDDASLSEVVADLQAIEGSEWPTLPDAWAELERIRHGDEDKRWS
jgi:hypothetical protein